MSPETVPAGGQISKESRRANELAPRKVRRIAGPLDRITLNRLFPNENEVIDSASLKIRKANSLELCTAIA
jgi:hypothetical protein